MKILVGSFQCESNTFSPQLAVRENFHTLYGREAIDKLAGSRPLLEAGAELVPMGYAVALPSGKVCKRDYLAFLSEFLAVAEKHRDADGVYLYFHGAMAVEEIGSGEEYFVAELRKVIGNETPVSVACDFHSIVTDRYAASINALSGFRTAPHTDYDETEYRAANALLRIIREKLSTKVIVERVPVLLADAAQTAFEPYRTILGEIDALDKEPHIVAASVFNGQPWVDSEYVGACVALTCCDKERETRAKAKALADYFWDHRGEIRFSVPALLPDATIAAISAMEKPVFVSDSGDNTTAGADGRSTFLMSKFLRSDVKRVLIASLLCEEICEKYKDLPLGTAVEETIAAPDRYSEDLTVKGTLVGRGTILGFVKEEAGEGIVVRCGNADIVISDVRTAFISAEHFAAMRLDPKDYDCVVVKLGYLWPEVAPLAASTVFCLTPGTSTNDFSTLDYKNTKREYFYVK